MARWSMALVCLVLGALAGSFKPTSVLQGQNAPPPPVAVELTSYRDIVKRVLPAVVSIEGRVKPKAKAEKSAPRRKFNFEDQQIPEEFRKFFEEFEKHQMDTPDEAPQLGFGSGFLIDPKGVVLTNYHVVAAADQVVVQLKDGRKFLSRDIHGDRKTDLAIVRLQAKIPLPYLELGDSDAMEIGDRVLAVGAPFGLTGTVTAGIVSAKGRNGLNVNMYEDFLQTDAAINPGNSGGPLVNLQGKVIGINSAIKSRTGGFQGVGLAIASNLAKNVMEALQTTGVVHRGFLGVQISDLNPEVAAQFNLKDEGVVVGRVFEGSPAGKAGVQAGDILITLGGKGVKDGRELQRVVAGLPLHKPVEIRVLREGKPLSLSVTIEEQPETIGAANVPTKPAPKAEEKTSVNLDKIGVEVKDLTTEMADELGFKSATAGALIMRVEPESPAADAGLRRGLLITRVDKQAVDSATSARQKLDKASLEKGILLQVESPRGGTNYVVVKSESNR